MSILDPLGHSGFRNLWFAQVVSKFGDSVHELALIWLVTTQTNDPVSVSIVVAASLLPDALMSLPAGAVVDRVNRKYVLVGTDVIRGLTVVVIPLVGPGPWLVPVVITVAVVTGLAQSFFAPAKFGAVPSLVPESDLDAANSLLSSTVTASRMLYVAGGAVVAVVGTFQAFYVDAASFLVSAVILSTLPTDDLDPEADPSQLDLRGVVGDVREGLSFVSQTPVLASVIAVIVSMQVAMGPLEVVLSFLVERVLTGSSATFGVLLGGMFGGMFLGSLVVGSFGDEVADYRGVVIPAGILAAAVALAGAAVAPGVVTLTASLGVFGAAFMLVRIPIDTLVQIETPSDQIGRVSSILRLAARSVPPASVALAGPLVAAVGPRTTLQAQSGVIGVVFLVALLLPISGVDLSSTIGKISRRGD